MLDDLPLLANIEAEQNVLGALLMEDAAWDAIAELICESDFYRMEHAVIFRHVAKLVKAGQRIDVVSVSNSLDESGVNDQVGGIAYLATMQQNTPSARNIRRYAEIVLERSRERRLLLSSDKISKLAMEREGRTLLDRLGEAQKLLESIGATETSQREMSAAEAMHACVRAIQERIDRPDGVLGGLPTGLSALDEQLDGLRDGELIVVGGRPSMGKSCIGEMISRVNAMQGRSVRLQSYEMPAPDIMARSSAASMGIKLENIRKARMTMEEYELFAAFVSQAHEWKLFIDDEPARIDKIMSRARVHKRMRGLDLLVIDHLHLIPRPGRNEVQELGDITAQLKRLATELQIPVVLLAQLNRGPTQGAMRAPTLTDLRGSGAIEQDADVVLFPHRAGYYDENVPPGEAEIIIAKHRNGPVGVVGVGWRGDFVRFQNKIPTDWNPPKRHVANQWDEDL
jgi:replicative DNA helicase